MLGYEQIFNLFGVKSNTSRGTDVYSERAMERLANKSANWFLYYVVQIGNRIISRISLLQNLRIYDPLQYVIIYI